MGSANATTSNMNPRDADRAAAHQARAPRTRTCLNGKLVYGDAAFIGETALTPDGAFTLDCVIRDISDQGAKVVLTKRQLLPSDLYLIVVKHGVVYRARLVWSEFPARGLKFTQTYLLGAALPEEQKYLRRLWLELCARTGSPDL